VRARFTTTVLIALGALAVGALTIAAGLAVSDADKWPGWLRPYHRWGWPAVWVLLAAFVALAVWQYTHPPSPPAGGASPSVRGEDSGPVAAGDVTISGGQGPTAGRDAHTVTGGTGPTAGRDIITNITVPAVGPDRPPAGARQVSTTPIANLPARNRAFTGRAELLDQLRQQLITRPAAAAAVAVTALPTDPPTTVAADRDAPPQVLHGLGGIGKTQLAAEYAHRHASDYPIRWWIPAEQPAAIPGQLVALARQLGIPEHSEQTVTVAALRTELGRRGDWLLIFDNVEDPHDLRPYWPSTDAGGWVLVTSRNPNWQPLAATLPVDVLPRSDAIAFLQGRVGLDKQDANALAEALGDLPLALEQAAAYLVENSTPVGEYLELLRDRGPELFALGQPATSEQTIATTWAVSLDRIAIETPPAQDLLSLCAFLAPDDLPRSLLAEHPGELPGPLANAVYDRVGFQQALGALRRYSLATVTAEAVSVHRLVPKPCS
jgi:NB-ARC domain